MLLTIQSWLYCKGTSNTRFHDWSNIYSFKNCILSNILTRIIHGDLQMKLRGVVWMRSTLHRLKLNIWSPLVALCVGVCCGPLRTRAWPGWSSYSIGGGPMSFLTISSLWNYKVKKNKNISSLNCFGSYYFTDSNNKNGDYFSSV